MPITDKDRGLHLLTHSRMACFKTCPRKHFYCYLCGLRKDRESEPLRFGKMFHLALEWLGTELMPEIARCIRKNYANPPGWVDSEERQLAWDTECEKILRLVAAYEWRWREADENITVIHREITFNLPLKNPETNRPSRNFRLAGKIDKIVLDERGQEIVREHKTTGDSIDSNSDYWLRCQMDAQISLYHFAAKELGHSGETIEYDVIHKPGINPRKLTKAEQKEHPGLDREDTSMYGARLTADIGNRPDFYYARRNIPRLTDNIREFRQELWWLQKVIQHSIATGWHYRNTSACTAPFRCDYLDICHNQDSDTEIAAGAAPEGFKFVDYIHPELEEHNNVTTEQSTTDAAATDKREEKDDGNDSGPDLEYNAG